MRVDVRVATRVDFESQRSGLNRRPPDYESGALPLSYAGDRPCAATAMPPRCSCRATAMPKSGLEPLRLSAPPPQDGVSTNFTTWATRRPNCTNFRAGLTGLEPATSGVTVRHSNQLSYSPLLPLCGSVSFEEATTSVHEIPHTPPTVQPMTTRDHRSRQPLPDGATAVAAKPRSDPNGS